MSRILISKTWNVQMVNCIITSYYYIDRDRAYRHFVFPHQDKLRLNWLNSEIHKKKEWAVLRAQIVPRDVYLSMSDIGSVKAPVTALLTHIPSLFLFWTGYRKILLPHKFSPIVEKQNGSCYTFRDRDTISSGNSYFIKKNERVVKTIQNSHWQWFLNVLIIRGWWRW